MNLFHRVNKCFGLTLWRSAKRHVELWLCFSGVPAHTHPGQNAEIVPLFGWSRFYRVTPEGKEQCVRISPRTWLRAFTVPAGWVHWFTGVPVLFLNCNDTGESAGVNFVVAPLANGAEPRRLRSRLLELA